MGLLTGGLAGRRFRVDGRLPEGFRNLFLEQVRANAFADDDTAADGEPRIGWVEVFDPSRTAFELNDLLIEQYLALTLRVDTKKVQGQYRKIALSRRLAEVCAERGIERLTKPEQEALTEALEADLLRRALPSVALTDVVWDVHTGRFVVFSTAEATVELVRQLTKETFGVAIRPERPIDWLADRMPVEEVTERIAASLPGGAAAGDDPLEGHHLALGSDFLVWLWLQSETHDGRFRVIEAGPRRGASLPGGDADGGDDDLDQRTAPTVVEPAWATVDPDAYESAPTVVNEAVPEAPDHVAVDIVDHDDDDDDDPDDDGDGEDEDEDEDEVTEAMRHTDLTLWIDSRLKLRELTDEAPSTTILLGVAPSATPEARHNLHLGKRPVEALLGLQLNDLQCTLTLRATAEGIAVSGLKIPFAVKSGRHEKLLERMVLLDLVHGTIERLFHQFFLARTSPAWQERVARWLADDVAAK